jgi:hypothetical protein
VVRYVREQRMVQSVQQSGFPLERLRQILVAVKGFLYGNGAAELLVGRAIDRTHPSHANLLLDEESVLQNCPDFDHLSQIKAITVPS